MDRITPITAFDVPIGHRKVELQQVDLAAGGISLLRVRIREGSRFTVFDLDPVTAGAWGEAMQAWAASQLPEKAR